MRTLVITDDGQTVAMSCDDGLIQAVTRALRREAFRRQDGTPQGALDTYVLTEQLGSLIED